MWCGVPGGAGSLMIIWQVVFRPLLVPHPDPPVSCLYRVLFSLCAGKVGVGNFLAGIPRDLPQLVDVRREQIKETRRLQLDLFYIRGFAPTHPRFSFSLNRRYDHFSGRLDVASFYRFTSWNISSHIFQILWIFIMFVFKLFQTEVQTLFIVSF